VTIGDPPNGTAYRLQSLERRLDRLENLEPAVMRQEITDIKIDLSDLLKDMRGLRRTLLGFIVTFAVASITIVVLILTSVSHAKT
jgi:hypothetical protein